MSSPSDKASKDLPDLPAPPARTLALIFLAFSIGYGITRTLEIGNADPVTGYIYSESTRIFAEESGEIQDILVQTGKLAEETSLLCTIQNTLLHKQVSGHEELIAQIEQELVIAKAKSEVELAWRNKSLDQEILQTRLNAASYLQEKYNQQIEKHVWKQYLNRPRRVSHLKKPDEIFSNDQGVHDLKRYQIRAQLEQESAQNAEEVTTVQLRLCEKRLDSLKNLKKELPSKIRKSIGISSIETRLNQEKQTLKSLLEKDTTSNIKSNAYGIVGPILFSPGDKIDKGDKLFEIYHPEQIYVKAGIPSLTAAKVDKGSVVQLHFPNGEKRKGRIRHKSFIASQIVNELEKTDSEDSNVEIIIEPVGKNWPKVSFGTAIRVRTL